MIKHLKEYISIISFISAIIIGFIAVFIPPEGIIDASVLWFTAQLLVFTSGLLGVNITLDSLMHRGKTNKNKEEEENDNKDI